MEEANLQTQLRGTTPKSPTLEAALGFRLPLRPESGSGPGGKRSRSYRTTDAHRALSLTILPLVGVESSSLRRPVWVYLTSQAGLRSQCTN